MGGADVIFDIMGASYLDRNIDALAPDGRVVIIGMQGGVKGELNIAKLLAKRAGVIGTALGPLLLRWAGVEHPAARGLSYGLNAHAIGTARALEEGDECGAFAALGMSLLGILIALLLPFALG